MDLPGAFSDALRIRIDRICLFRRWFKSAGWVCRQAFEIMGQFKMVGTADPTRQDFASKARTPATRLNLNCRPLAPQVEPVSGRERSGSPLAKS
jgi:hypothetical protein